MLKIANEQIAAVTARAAATMRAQNSRIMELEAENGRLHDKLASVERDQVIAVLAQEMEDKGLNPELSLSEKIASLHRVSDLNRVQDAVSLASASGVRLADLSTLPGRASGTDGFTSYLLTGGAQS